MPTKKKEIDIIEEAKKVNKSSKKEEKIEPVKKAVAKKPTKKAVKTEPKKEVKKEVEKVEKKVVAKKATVKKPKEEVVEEEWVKNVKDNLKEDSFESLSNAKDILNTRMKEKDLDKYANLKNKEYNDLLKGNKDSKTLVVMLIILGLLLGGFGYILGANKVNKKDTEVVETAHSTGVYDDGSLSFEYPTEWYIDDNGQFYKETDGVLSIVGVVYKNEEIEKEDWNTFVETLESSVEGIVELDDINGYDIPSDTSRSVVLYNTDAKIVYEIYMQNLETEVEDALVESVKLINTTTIEE